MQSGKFFGASTNIFEITKYLVLALALAAAFFMLVGVPLLVQGVSMQPNFHTGELVIVEKVSYWGDKPIKRGDVVAAVFPGDPKHTRLIKRVIGLPGETVTAKGGIVSVNGNEIKEPYLPIYGDPPYQELTTLTLKSDEYYLVGDNRPGSSDSRLWGAVARPDIQGRAAFIIWPLNSVRYIDRLSN